MFADSAKSFMSDTPPRTPRYSASTLSRNSSNITGTHDPVEGISEFGLGLVVFFTVVTLTGLISNSFILITVFRRMVTRNTVNVFLSSLAFSDLIMILLSLLDGFAYMQGGWNYGEALCKIQSYFVEVMFTASTLTLVAVSCERYLLICHPHMKRRTINSIYRILCGVWVLALFLCTPLLHGYVVIQDEDLDTGAKKNVCGNLGWPYKHRRIFYSIYAFITYLIPLLIMAFAHWQISMSVKDSGRRSSSTAHNTLQSDKNSVCFTIREESSGGSTDHTTDSFDTKSGSGGKQQNGVQKGLLSQFKFGSLQRKVKQSNAEKDYNRREKRMKAIRLLFVVTVTFFILWTPFIVMRLLLLSGVKIIEYIYKFSEILIFSSTAVNGFIYAFMSPPFRKAFKALLCCQVRRELVSRDSGPSISNSEDNRLMSHRMNSRGSSLSYHVELSMNKGGNHV